MRNLIYIPIVLSMLIHASCNDRVKGEVRVEKDTAVGQDQITKYEGDWIFLGRGVFHHWGETMKHSLVLSIRGRDITFHFLRNHQSAFDDEMINMLEAFDEENSDKAVFKIEGKLVTSDEDFPYNDCIIADTDTLMDGMFLWTWGEEPALLLGPGDPPLKFWSATASPVPPEKKYTEEELQKMEEDALKDDPFGDGEDPFAEFDD